MTNACEYNKLKL